MSDEHDDALERLLRLVPYFRDLLKPFPRLVPYFRDVDRVNLARLAGVLEPIDVTARVEISRDAAERARLSPSRRLRKRLPKQ